LPHVSKLQAYHLNATWVTEEIKQLNAIYIKIERKILRKCVLNTYFPYTSSRTLLHTLKTTIHINT